MWKLFAADLKMMVRNKQSIFWALMFPLIFTFIFGFFFGKNASLGSVAFIDKANNQISVGMKETLEKTEIFNINEESDLEYAKDQIKRSKISALVYVPENFGVLPGQDKEVEIIYDQGSQSISGLQGIIDKYLTAVNYQAQNSKPILNISAQPVSDRKLTYFDFVLAGILGLSLMNSSIIGIGVGMAKYREDKILKRITTTPVKSLSFIVAEILSRLVLNVFQISVILAIGTFLFDAHIYGNIFVVLGISMIGAIMFQLFGFVVAALSKTTDAAQGMATAITIPMMFLAGVFFPIDSLPKWLYTVVQYLPLAPILRIIRGVTLEAQSPFFEPRNILIVLSWILVTLLISVWKFRLSDE